jgi:hypothetical protein
VRLFWGLEVSGEWNKKARSTQLKPQDPCRKVQYL